MNPTEIIKLVRSTTSTEAQDLLEAKDIITHIKAKEKEIRLLERRATYEGWNEENAQELSDFLKINWAKEERFDLVLLGTLVGFSKQFPTMLTLQQEEIIKAFSYVEYIEYYGDKIQLLLKLAPLFRLWEKEHLSAMAKTVHTTISDLASKNIDDEYGGSIYDFLKILLVCSDQDPIIKTLLSQYFYKNKSAKIFPYKNPLTEIDETISSFFAAEMYTELLAYFNKHQAVVRSSTNLDLTYNFYAYTAKAYGAIQDSSKLLEVIASMESLNLYKSELYFFLAEYQKEQSNPKASLEALNYIIQKEGRSAKTLYKLIDYHQSVKEYELCLGLFDEICEKSVFSINSLLKKIEFCLEHRFFDEITQILQSTVSKKLDSSTKKDIEKRVFELRKFPSQEEVSLKVDKDKLKKDYQWLLKMQHISLEELLEMKELTITKTEQSEIIIKGLPKLKKISCSDNAHLSSLVIELPNLIELDCRFNKLTKLLVDCPKLLWLNCSKNQLTDLNLALANLSELDCSENQLNALSLKLPDLIQLNCAHNQLKSLELDLARLERLICSKNQISEIHLKLPNLSVLKCAENELESLDLKMDKLQELDCSYNYLTEISLNTPGLDHLLCSFNPIEKLVLDLPHLNILECERTLLTELDINTPKLTKLKCSGNRLTARPQVPKGCYISA